MQFNWTFSIVASIILTLALNLIPRLFPNATRRAGQKILEKIDEDDHIRSDPGLQRPKVRVYFPWKAMLVGSVLLTVVLNVFGLFAR